jgi:hypothetical protein
VTFVFSKAERHWQAKLVNPIADFDVCNKKKPMNITIKEKIQQS